MTRLYTEPQLDFCDVLFQPKRTTFYIVNRQLNQVFQNCEDIQ